MTLFGLEIRSRSRAGAGVRIVRGPELLSEEKLEQILGLHGPAHPLLRALLQLIETAEDNANRSAAADAPNREKFVGGAEQLRLLRDDIFIRQENYSKRRGRVEIEHRTIGSDE